MPPPRRKLQETFEATLNPPSLLPDTQQITRIVKAEGKNLYSVQSATSQTLLVELQPKFRSSIWLRRGGFVLVDLDRCALGDRDNKIDGEIVNVVRDEKQWRKMPYWPVEFPKKAKKDNRSNVGQLPSSDDEDIDGAPEETSEKQDQDG